MDRNKLVHTLIRVAVGVIFFAHGLQKLQAGMPAVAGMFEGMGFPGFVGYIAFALEFFGGIALILGLGTRVVSVLFAVEMIVATLKVKLAAGFLGGYELDLTLILLSLFLMTSSQPYSLDQLLFKKEAKGHLAN